MLSSLSYAVRAVRHRGLRFLIIYFKESLWFDLRNGTSTSARVPKEKQSISSHAEENNGLLYVASFTSVVLRSIALVQRLLGPQRFADSQFFDLGCGKGKALLVTALRRDTPQNHTSIGIEYDPKLAEIARSNLRRCKVSEELTTVVTDSATNFSKYVTSEMLVVYVYNSFQGETLRKVLEELKRYAHVLIYVDPAEREMLPEFGYIILEDVKGRYNADTWLVATLERNLAG